LDQEEKSDKSLGEGLHSSKYFIENKNIREYILIFCVCHVRRIVVKIAAAPRGLARIQALLCRYKLGDDPKEPTVS